MAKWLILLWLVLPLVPSPAAAQAPAGYQGMYVIIDPYNTQHVGFLQTAASASCVQDTRVPVSPFCGAANGILLRINWCDYQLYRVANPAGGFYPSCHYSVGEVTPGVPPVTENPVSDTISPCTGKYDICGASVLDASLALIAKIDTRRATAGLPPLLLSVGLAAGSFTAQTVFDTAGYVDLPVNEAQGNAASTNYQCVRLPLVWKPKYLPAFDAALDSLLATITTKLGTADSRIVIVKAASIAASSLELSMPGRTNVIAAPVDPGPGGPGPLLSCPTTQSGAALWLATYNKSAVTGYDFAQAIENVFGATLGHALGSAENAGYGGVLLSVPTNNAVALASVDCGANAAVTCAVKASGGNYSMYYMDDYIGDLFDGGLAGQSAQTAYDAIRPGTFSLTAAQLAVNDTGLSPSPIASASEVECNLNNTNPVNETSFALDGATVPILGPGTAMGWQTLFNSGALCAAGTYGEALENGISDGGLFEEVETDAAFTDLPACNGYLTTALSQLVAATPPTTCQY